jgi:SprT protein
MQIDIQALSYDEFKKLKPSNALCLKLEESVAAHVEMAERYFNTCYESFKVEINLRGRSAGQVRYSNRHQSDNKTFNSARIRFNPCLLALQGDAFIAEVVPHEVAHYVAYSQFGFGIKPHGVEWQYVMRQVFASTPDVTHGYYVPSRPTQSFIYHCGCEQKTHNLSKVRHQKVLSGKARYLCKVCKAILVESSIQSNKGSSLD